MLNDDVDALHSVSSFRKDFNNQLLVIGRPTFHFPVRINEGPNVVIDVLHLSTLAMQGNMTEMQSFKDSFDVGLGPACDANAQILKP